MDFAGFKDPSLGRKRKQNSSQSGMLVYGIIAAIGVVLLILIFSLISKSNDITRYTDENEGLQNQLNEMLQQKSKTAQEVNSLTQEVSTLKKENKDKEKEEKKLDKEQMKLEKERKDLNGMIGEMNDELNVREREYAQLQDTQSDLMRRISSFPMDRTTYEQKKLELLSTISKLEKQLSEEVGDSDDSNILRPSEFKTISKWISGSTDLTFKLIYRMSDDGFSADIFHEKCGNRKVKSNIVVVETKEGDVFGGYTNNNWGDSGFMSDVDAFVFNINTKTKFGVASPSEATFTDGRYLCVFGQGDLAISERQCYSQFPFSYGSRNDQRGDLTNGREVFEIKELEVFSVVW